MEAIEKRGRPPLDPSVLSKRWRVGLWLTQPIHQRLKHLAVSNNTSMAEIVAQAILEWLKWIKKAEIQENIESDTSFEKAMADLQEIQFELEKTRKRLRKQPGKRWVGDPECSRCKGRGLLKVYTGKPAIKCKCGTYVKK